MDLQEVGVGNARVTDQPKVYYKLQSGWKMIKVRYTLGRMLKERPERREYW